MYTQSAAPAVVNSYLHFLSPSLNSSSDLDSEFYPFSILLRHLTPLPFCSPQRQRLVKHREEPKTSKMGTAKHQRSEKPRCSAPETRKRNYQPPRVANHRSPSSETSKMQNIIRTVFYTWLLSAPQNRAKCVSHNNAMRGVFSVNNTYSSISVPVRSLYCTALPRSKSHLTYPGSSSQYPNSFQHPPASSS